MIFYITIFILALLVPVIILPGIDQPFNQQEESSFNEVATINYFKLPRGQPGLRASIIQNKSLPRNKGEPRNNTS
jgi:hypothetical protein